jgi:4-amino-4-deoxy-L-arabinose transferase-like glycosyltransferase
MSLQPLSDVLATVWCLAAVSTALQSQKNRAWALVCGTAFSVAVLVRATNFFLLPALLLLLGWNLPRLSFAALGGVPGAVFLGCYNHVLYGGVFRSGYVDIAEAFAWAYGPPTVVHFVKWLALMLPAVVLPLAIFGFLRRDIPARTRTALALWFGIFFGFYAFYEISREVWWDLRFILPGTPALIVAGLLGLEKLVQTQRARAGAASVLMVWAVALGWYWPKKFHLLLTKQYEQAYATAAAAALARFPANSLVLAGHHSGSLYFYTPFPVLRWELVTADEFDHYRELAQKAGRTICALLYDIEENEALKVRCRGQWTRIETLKNVSLWRLEPSGAAPK